MANYDGYSSAKRLVLRGNVKRSTGAHGFIGSGSRALVWHGSQGPSGVRKKRASGWAKWRAKKGTGAHRATVYGMPRANANALAWAGYNTQAPGAGIRMRKPRVYRPRKRRY